MKYYNKKIKNLCRKTFIMRFKRYFKHNTHPPTFAKSLIKGSFDKLCFQECIWYSRKDYIFNFWASYHIIQQTDYKSTSENQFFKIIIQSKVFGFKDSISKSFVCKLFATFFIKAKLRDIFARSSEHLWITLLTRK